ncbi:conserved hypothetical protein [Ricinus communis]|uniref:Uncharacterized protein n=1 Tax=Ricinus communis TaxID=3988 RepID=B9T202_RICCO|nr:conserved hypothetical protein [Ricinus communis]
MGMKTTYRIAQQYIPKIQDSKSMKITTAGYHFGTLVLVVGGSGGELMGEDDGDLRGLAVGAGDPGARL